VEWDSFELGRENFENGWCHEGDIQIVNPRTGRTYTSSEWRHDLRLAVQNIHDRSRTTTLFFVNLLRRNGIEVLRTYDELDGFYIEGYAGPCQTRATMPDYWFRASWPPEEFGPGGAWGYYTNWFERDVAILTEAEAKGKYSVLCMNGILYDQQGQGDRAIYGLASLLMGIKGPDAKLWIYSWTFGRWEGLSRVPLAWFVPVGDMRRTEGYYEREFASEGRRTVAYANPTLETYSVELEEPMYPLLSSGAWSPESIISLDLGRFIGAILTDDRT